MILKQSPQDFIVNEIYDLEQLKEEKGVGGNYAYFKFTKINLSGQKAIIFLAQKLQIASKRIHICGTKDKVAITTQLISIQQCNKDKAEEFQETINSNSEDMKLEYIGQFNQRLNLSNNLGNRFEITLEDLSEEEKGKFKNQEEEFEVYNFFQTQRFGICKNTHKIGLLLIKNQIKDAVFEILLSLPQDVDENVEEYKILVQDVRDNFDKYSQEELKEKYRKIQEVFPQFLNGYETIIKHLFNTPKDVSGALRTLPKKLRTLYVHAFQSAIFNKHIQYIKENNLNVEEVCLVGYGMNENSAGYDKNVKLLNELNIEIDDLKLSHMPELQLQAIKKPIYSIVKNYQCREVGENSVIISFDLGVGCYATQVIAEIAEDNSIITF